MRGLSCTIKYFGAFRKLGENITLSIEQGSSIFQIKQSLIKELGDQHKALIGNSVLANNTDILPEAFIVRDDIKLSILPPVCGG